MKLQKRCTIVMLLLILVTSACCFPALSETSTNTGIFDQVRRMQYHSIADILHEQRMHIADWIFTPECTYSFEDYVVRIEEIATDGYTCYANLSIEMLREEAIVLPAACADEADIHYIPFTVHNAPVYFFDLHVAVHKTPDECSGSVSWAVSEDMKAIELVASNHGNEDFDRPSSKDLTLHFLLSVTRYENGQTSTARHEIHLDYSLACSTERYRFCPSADMKTAVTALGLEAPTFQAILTPFELYTPGFNVVFRTASGGGIAESTHTADGMEYAWFLWTKESGNICKGDVYEQFPTDIYLLLIRFTPEYKLVHSWKLEVQDGYLLTQSAVKN